MALGDFSISLCRIYRLTRCHQCFIEIVGNLSISAGAEIPRPGSYFHNGLRGIAHRLHRHIRIEKADDTARAAFQALVAPGERADQAALSQHHLYVARSPSAGQSRPRKSESPDPPRKARAVRRRPRSSPSRRGAVPARRRVARATRHAAARDTRATAFSDRTAEAPRRPEAFAEVRCS